MPIKSRDEVVPPGPLLTRKGITKLLRQHVFVEYRKISTAAKKLGVCESTLSNYMNGKRPMPDWLLEALGYERIDLYTTSATRRVHSEHTEHDRGVAGDQGEEA